MSLEINNPDYVRDSVRLDEMQQANITKLRRMISSTIAVVRQASSNSLGSFKRKSESCSSLGSHLAHNMSKELLDADPLFSPAHSTTTHPERTSHKSISLADVKKMRSVPRLAVSPQVESESAKVRRQMQCFSPSMDEIKPPSEPGAPDELSDETDHDEDEAHSSPHLSDSDEEGDADVLSQPTPGIKRQHSLSMPASFSGAGKRPTLEDISKKMTISHIRSPRGVFNGGVPSQLRVLVTTFNTAGNVPRRAELHNWLPLDADGLCDIIAIGLQECGSGNNQSKSDIKRAKTSLRMKKPGDLDLEQLANELDGSPGQSDHKLTPKEEAALERNRTMSRSGTEEPNTPSNSNPPSLSRGISKMFSRFSLPHAGAQSMRMTAAEKKAVQQLSGRMNSKQPSGASEASDSAGPPKSPSKSPAPSTLQRRPSAHESMMRFLKGKSKSVRIDKANRTLLNEMIEQELREAEAADAAKRAEAGESGERPPELRKTVSGKIQRRGSAAGVVIRAKNSIMNSSSKKTQIDKAIMQHYGPGYKKVATENLGEMRLIVLCRTGLKPHVTGVKKAHKATGIGGVLGNKGGVMVKVKVANTDLCFLSCHLTAHESEDKVNRRNQDVHDILKATSNASKQHLDIAQRYHHTFLFGDLNYRINLGILDQQERDCNLHRLQVMKMIHKQDYKNLYKADQLQREVHANNVLRGFQETAPDFPPTFKVTPEIGLDYNLHRIPSYCDRILWTSLPGLEGRVKQDSYYAVEEVSCSDHKPVVSTFTITAPSEYSDTLDTHRPAELSPRRSMMNLHGGGQRKFELRVSRIKALNVSDEIYSAQFLQLKFHSTVMAHDTIVSPQPPGEQETNFLVDMCFDVPTMPVKAQSPDTLRGKHLVLSLWGDKKCKKLMGQAVLSLTSVADCGSSPTIFDVPLLRYGVACGEISGVFELVDVSSQHRQSVRNPSINHIGKALSKTFSKTISVDF